MALVPVDAEVSLVGDARNQRYAFEFSLARAQLGCALQASATCGEQGSIDVVPPACELNAFKLEPCDNGAFAITAL